MSAQPTELFARLIDLFGNPATADPTKLYGNLTMRPDSFVGVGTGILMPDGYNVVATSMGRNRIINGEMLIAQRSTSVTGTLAGYQTVDRFGCNTASGSGHTIAQIADAPTGFLYSLKLTVGTGASPAAGNFNGIWQNIEGYNVTDFSYGTANAAYGVLTFWVKSSVAGTYAVGFMNNALNRNYITTYTINSTNTWEQKTIVIPGDTIGTWAVGVNTGLSICWDIGSGSTYQTSTLNTWQAGQMYGTSTSTKLISTSSATWQLTGVQFEKGQFARPFDKRQIGNETLLCRRYYYQITNPAGNGQAYAGTGIITSATTILIGWQFPVNMRVSPTISSNNLWLTSQAAQYAGTATALSGYTSQDMIGVQFTASGASFTAGQAGGIWIGNTSNSGGSLNFSAEL